MIEPLDFPKLETVCWRALCRHDMTLRQMVMASTIIRLSFVAGEPSLRVNYMTELAILTGMSKGNAHGVVRELMIGRALEVSPDRRVLTFLPPSKAWPWLFASRVLDEQAADELESGLIWANKGGGAQGELFAPPVEEEFAEALQIERMRAGLLEYHKAASAPHERLQVCSSGSASGPDFPVKDRQPKSPAPPTTAANPGELARPLGTGATDRDVSALESLPPEGVPASYYYHADSPGGGDGGASGSQIGNAGQKSGFPIREPVPDSGTPHLNAFNASMSSVPATSTDDTKALNALNAEFPIREPNASVQRDPERMDWRSTLGPEASEEDILRWLRGALGGPAMVQWGGFWRNAIRECRLAVLESINNYKLRVQTRGFPNYPGGWLKNQYMRFLKVIKPEKKP